MLIKNIIAFYTLLLIPVGIIVLSVKYGYINSNTFIFLLFTYTFIYHPLICGLRLIENKKIKRQDLWKNLIPFWNDKYWAFLFFNK